MFSPKSFIVSDLTFRSLIHVEFIFVYGVRKCSNFFVSHVAIQFCLGSKSLQMVIAAMKLRRLLIGRKVMTDLDSILKSRDITLPTKVCLVKAMVFPVVIYGCESWTVEKVE